MAIENLSYETYRNKARIKDEMPARYNKPVGVS